MVSAPTPNMGVEKATREASNELSMDRPPHRFVPHRRALTALPVWPSPAGISDVGRQSAGP